MCAIDNYTLFRNDANTSNSNVRPFSGTAMYSQIDFYPGYPYFSNSTGVEITVIRCKDCSTCTYIWNIPLTSCAILQYHAPPSWIEGCTKTRPDRHPGRHAEGGFSAAWSKSLRNVPFFDASFIETWLETDGEVPKKVVTRGYSNFCEGYIFDVEGKSFISVSNLTATLV